MIIDRTGSVLFDVDVSSIHGEAVLVLHGELDLWSHPRFVAALAGVEYGCTRVVLDLADLTFIDAGNIRLIHRARRQARQRGSDLVLRSPNRNLFRILDIAGLGPAWNYQDLIPDGLPAISQRAVSQSS